MEKKVRKPREASRAKERTAKYYDYNLVFLTVFLTVIGLIMIFSATAYQSSSSESSMSDSFFSQAIYAVIGLVMMVLTSFFDYHRYRGMAVFGVLVSIVLIVLVKVPGVGYSSHGASRWIKVAGVTLQVAEVVKIAVILYSALIISRISKQVSEKKGIIVLFSVSGFLAALLLFVTNNLSSAIIVVAISFCMFFVAHPKIKPFLIFVGIAAACVVIVVIYAVVSGGSGSFRLERIDSWLHPENYSTDSAYQNLQALYAIGSGGLFGKGLGSSAQKLLMPEVQNDMIFSVICEELGLFGAMVVILLFILLLYRIIYIARNTKDSFGAMLAIGVFSHIAVQVVLNIAVVTGSIPNTGVSLPFISAGGSSLIFLMMEMGMVLNIARHIPYGEPETRPEVQA